MYSEIQVQDQLPNWFVLSELISADAITHSILFNHGTSKCIALVRKHTIDIYRYDNTLGLLDKAATASKPTSSKVISIARFHSLQFEHDSIVYLTESLEVYFLFIEGDFRLFHSPKVPIFSHGYQLSQNCTPAVLPQRTYNPNYLLIHIFEGALFRLSVKELRASLGTNEGRETVPPTPTIIGGTYLSILQVVPLIEPRETFAAVCRENYNYTLCFFEIRRKGEINVTQNFGQLEQLPSVLIPMSQGGVLAAVTGGIFYFYPQGLEVKAPQFYPRGVNAAEQQDKTIFINQEQNYLVKSLLDGEACSEKFVSFTRIDQTSKLLVSQTGNAYKLTFCVGTKKSKTTVYLKEFKLESMGYLTIPNPIGLDQIIGNKFFQSSQFSQSVLFEISSKDIRITSVVDSNPPILDLEPALDQVGNLELFVSHGGVGHAELRKYTWSSYFIKSSLTKNYPEHQFSSIKLIDRKALIYTIDKGHLTFDLKTLEEAKTKDRIPKHQKYLDFYISQDFECFVSPDSIIMEDKPIKIESSINEIMGIEEKIIKTRPIIKALIAGKSSIVVVITEDMVGHIYRGNKKVFEFKCVFDNQEVEIDVLDSYYNEMVMIYSWSGGYRVYKSAGTTFTLIVDKPGTNEVFSSTLLRIDGGMFTAIQSMHDGSIQQDVFDSNGQLKNSYIFHPRMNSPPYTITKEENKAILFNRQEILVVNIPCKSGLLNYSLFPSNRPIIDAKALVDNQVIVAFENGDISILLFKERSITTQPNDYPKNCCKCIDIPNSQYLVGLCRDGQVLLMDKYKFTTVSKYPLITPSDAIKDICYFPTEEGGHFLALIESKTSVHIFKIINDQISLLKKITLENIPTTELRYINLFEKSPSRFISAGNNQAFGFHMDPYTPEAKYLHFICAGRNQAFGFHVDPHTFEAKILPEDANLKVPHALVGNTEMGSKCYVGDILDGVLQVKRGFSEISLEKVQLEFNHHCLTTMDSVRLDQVEYLVSGDALGNISILMSNSRISNKVVAAFNIGDSISVIKAIPGNKQNLVLKMIVIGTSSGGLYLLSSLNNLRGIKEEDLKRCQNNMQTVAHAGSVPSLDWKYISEHIDNRRSGLHSMLLDARLIINYLEWTEDTVRPIYKKAHLNTTPSVNTNDICGFLELILSESNRL